MFCARKWISRECKECAILVLGGAAVVGLMWWYSGSAMVTFAVVAGLMVVTLLGMMIGPHSVGRGDIHLAALQAVFGGWPWRDCSAAVALIRYKWSFSPSRLC